MQKYIALLRGINVGGKNKISIPEFKKIFKEIGYEDVVTYINSGNVIFPVAMRMKTTSEQEGQKL